MKNTVKKILTVIIIQLCIAMIHFFRLGQLFHGSLYRLYYSYFSDFILPFGTYFLLSMNEFQIPFLRHYIVKSGIIFSIASAAEICQYFGIPVLGSTFDPVDFIMYGTGALLAALFDIQIFSRIFKFWNLDLKSAK